MTRVLFSPSIARRVFMAVLLACALVWGSIYLLGTWQVRRAESGEFDRRMLPVSDAIAALVAASGDERQLQGGLAGIDAFLGADKAVSLEPDNFLVFRVWRPDGSLLAGSAGAASDVPHAAHASGFFSTGVAGEAYRVHGRNMNGYRIEVFQSMRSRQQVFDSVMLSREGLVNPLLIGLPLLLVPVWIAIHSGLRPLQRLARELAQRSPTELGPIEEPPVYTELAPVVRELNSTLARFRDLLRTERDFLADAAHELRTPLALIATQADALIRADTAGDRADAARRLTSGMARVSRLLNQLLSLARLDAAVEAVIRRVDLADVVRDVLAAHAGEADKTGIELGYSGPECFVTDVPGDAVDSLLANLVSNAIRHGSPAGRVEVELALPGDGEVVLSIRDDGPGIAPAERTLVFERFRRGKDAAAPGSGLGLAIVASAARQLAATIVLEEGIGGRGVGFQVRWRSPGAGGA